MTEPTTTVPGAEGPVPVPVLAPAPVPVPPVVTKVEGEAIKLAPQVKPGLKTSEFVVTALTVLGSVLSLLLHKELDLSNYATEVVTALGALMAITYVAARTALKFGVVKGAAQKVLDTEKKLEG